MSVKVSAVQVASMDRKSLRLTEERSTRKACLDLHLDPDAKACSSVSLVAEACRKNLVAAD